MVKNIKTILYTGASSGIAKEAIKQLKKDYFIYVTVHTNNQLKLIKNKYQNEPNIKCLKLDITNQKDLEQVKKLDIDILINNAATGYGGSISEIPFERVRENYETNVFSSFELVQIVLKQMIEKKKGKIIIIGSIASIIPINFLGIYASTKASINKLTMTLRNELKLINKNIKITLIEPGLYHTGFNQVMLNNKYDFMEEKSYFKEELEIIKRKEKLLFNLLEKKNFKSIVNKIVKVVNSNNPKAIYRTPLSHAIGAKIYQIFKG